MTYEQLTMDEITAAMQQLDGWVINTNGDQPALEKPFYFKCLTQHLGL